MANPNTRTVADLITLAKNLADMTGSSFPDDGATAGARMLDYANLALWELHDILVESFEDYLQQSVTISVVAGTETYDLPDGTNYSAAKPFFKLLRVFQVLNGRYYEVPPINMTQLDAMKTAPVSTASLRLWYIPQMDRFTATTDTVGSKLNYVPKGAEDYIAYHMAVQLLAREESDVSFCANQLAQIRQRIINQAEKRDITSRQVIDKHRFTRRNRFDTLDRRFFYHLRGDVLAIYEVDPCV